jgi:two-component system cell cycle response regulator
VSNPQQKRILVIDDDAMNREVMEAFLQAEKYSVNLAYDGQQGISKATEWLPNLIILDIRMPDMTGFEVCEKLKQESKTAHIPIMIVSGFDAQEDHDRGIAVGAAGFLTRPFDADDLLDLVKNLVSS